MAVLTPTPPVSATCGLPPDAFAAAFPFHIELDRDLRVQRWGRSLVKIAPGLQAGRLFEEEFLVLRPEDARGSQLPIRAPGQLLLLEIRGTGVQLRGELVTLDGGSRLVFLGSPWIRSTAEIDQLGLQFTDFAVHDPVVDLLQMAQAQAMALQDSRKLLERLTAQRADLRTANERLRDQNQELLRTQDQLRQSEAESRKLAMVAALTDNAVILTDPEGRIEWVNESFTRITGHGLSDVAGRTPGSVLQGPDTDPATVQYIRDHLRQAVPFGVEILNYSREGRPYWVALEIQPVRDPSGRLTHFMAVESDVTERRRNELRRQAQHEVSRALAEAASLGEGLVRSIKALATACGFSVGIFLRPSAESPGLRCTDFWFAPALEGAGRLARALEALPAGAGTGQAAEAFARGEAVWAAPETEPVPGTPEALAAIEGVRGSFCQSCVAEGRGLGVLQFLGHRGGAPGPEVREILESVAPQIALFVVREMAELTARQAMEAKEAAMREARDAAEASNRAKSEFLATMSHEIRTPMSGVMGMTDLLLQTSLSERQRELGESIAQSASALLEVINDVLDFSRVEAGKLHVTREAFRVQPLLDSVLEVAAMRAPEKPLTLVALVEPGFPQRLLGDPVRIRQILLNLAGNAVKFTDRGHVAVRVRQAAAGWVRFEVEDTGPGLHPDQQRVIFEPFVQVDSSSTRRYSGSGLGLAISRRLVELLGGTIGVNSVPGRGSRFWMELPLEAVADEAGAVSQPLWSARFVVACADPLLAESVASQFRSWRLHAAQAGSVADAAALATPANGGTGGDSVLLLDEDLAPGGEPPPAVPGFHHRILLASPRSHWARHRIPPPGYRQVLLKPVKQSLLYDCITGALSALPTSCAPRPGDVSSPERPLVPPMRILLVEDHKTNRRLAELMLETLGLRADVATTGLEAVAAAAMERYDVILMDCHLPEIDGYEATRRIRAAEAAAPANRAARTSIVAVTANALLGERERCLDAGMDDYLTKPFTSKQLLAVLRRVGPASQAAPRPADAGAGSGKVLLSTAQSRRMAAELGRSEFEELARDFLSELPGEVDRLQAHLRAGERTDLHRVAHGLKGICLTLGLTELGSRLQSLEALARTGSAEELAQLLTETAACSRASDQALRDWLTAKPEVVEEAP